MFAKKENLLGLDIGSHSVKMTQLKAREGRLTLANVGLVPVPREAFNEGRVVKPDLVTNCIKQLLGHLKVKEKVVATAVSGYEVMIKKIELPTMTEEELDSRMHAELGQYIPYNIEEVDVDYQVLDVAKDRPNYMGVLLVAAKKESIGDCVGIIRSSGLDTDVVDVDFFALSNAFEATYGTFEGNIALIDIGSTKGIMNIASNGVPVFTRGISIGGSQITEGIRDHFKVSYEEAERLKLGELSPNFPVDEIEGIFISSVRNWVSECKRAIDFYYSNYPDKAIEKIYLSGGSCRIPGLDRVFQENMGVAVEIFNPLKRVDCDPKVFDPEYIEFIGPQVAISLGLALRKTKEK